MEPKERPQSEETERIVVAGRPDFEECDNQITTSKYNLLTFFPIAIKEQFRRVANLYFLIIGCIMAVGYYSGAFDSAISPWTTLGPLAIVISFSLLQEGSADYGRHKSDAENNSFPCVVLRREDELKEQDGKRDQSVNDGEDVAVDLRKAYFLPHRKGGGETPTKSASSSSINVTFESIARMNIRAGDLVLVRNRDMVPADIVLLASSSENGSAYIETSSIDGETNLKLRTSPHLPKSVVQIIRNESSRRLVGDDGNDNDDSPIVVETLDQATRRLARVSALGYPGGKSALDNPANPVSAAEEEEESPHSRQKPSSFLKRISEKGGNIIKNVGHGHDRGGVDSGEMAQSLIDGQEHYIATLKSEPPNASVNTYTGVLLMPPVELDGPSIEIPLNADNLLLRGAVLRNTEWAIGLACFTGTDTKLVQNSFEVPSKFSQLDKLMNWTVLLIICVMIGCIAALASLATVNTNNRFEELWYVGLNRDSEQTWPYLPDLDPPEWTTKPQNWVQVFFLFVTLLTNFVPLSLYVTIEFIIVAIRVFINLDIDMYDAVTDTRAVARSTTVTDLGQVQYVFSDKTGTLTQNVMRFKRCSVDGMIFGAPVEKTRPGSEKEQDGNDDETSRFHPQRQLLVGRVNLWGQPASSKPAPAGLEPLGGQGTTDPLSADKKLTFNAEMFLRVMSLCHTVVVEKDLDAPDESNRSASKSNNSQSSTPLKRIFGFGKASSSMYESGSADNNIEEEPTYKKQASSSAPAGMSKDGAPLGFAYQAESPDEGALVQAASATFGFQVIGRDSSGIRLACSSPTLLDDERVKKGLKNGSLTPKALAGEIASPLPEPRDGVNSSIGLFPDGNSSILDEKQRTEVWSILAVNKFDSDRKRMSVLVRSPPEFGSIPILFCKGADSSMLDSTICEGANNILSGNEEEDEIAVMNMKIPKPSSISSRGREESHASSAGHLEPVTEGADADDDDINRFEEAENWESAAILGMQAHLGIFASEGLRTLVLGMRVLTEHQCEEWLAQFTAASTSIKNREEKLTEVAKDIERNLHIVGATAIEDKLQRGVPETIAKLEGAGIKLWVLTGDKRETAIEIGYSTHVLTPKMHLTEVADGTADHVRALMATEFIRLVKMGKLTDYQRAAVDTVDHGRSFEDFSFAVSKFRRKMSRFVRRFFYKYVMSIFTLCCREDDTKEKNPHLRGIDEEEKLEKLRLKATERRRNVRDRAEKIIRAYVASPGGRAQRKRSPNRHPDDDELSLASDDLPAVFNRAQSARTMLEIRRDQGRTSTTELRTLSLAQLTAQEASGDAPLIDEDTLSLHSFFPNDRSDETNFDRKRRTLLERMFAVDSDVRHGRLLKHARRDVLQAIKEEKEAARNKRQKGDEDLGEHGHALTIDSPRALVIEGAALAHLLGDPVLEELLFAVASCSDSVIACRVSPKQKALLVKLVREYVVPEPVTLAIGDGANDVGMIQEAHVGIGISGKEGQQAVNASDFSIAQFRFLEELLLIHGRWSFFRQSTVVLFSFYKNAVMAGCLIVFTKRTLYSGTPLFDEWLIAMLNFVAAAPIAFLGFFDRCLDKEYVRNNPEVYGPGRRNELITYRILFRWVILVFVHVFTIYYFSVPSQSFGGGITPAFEGLMFNDDQDIPGNGEGGDLKSVGTTSFTCMIILLAFKVLYECRSILYGWWPAFTCRKGVGEGVINRLAYTWIGVSWLSIGFYLFAIYVYMLVGRRGAGTFSAFVDVPIHVFNMRSLSWMVVILVPIAGMAFDVCGKVYSNMFYPTQTQIHVEIDAKQKREQRKGKEVGSVVNQPGSISNV